MQQWMHVAVHTLCRNEACSDLGGQGQGLNVAAGRNHIQAKLHHSVPSGTSEESEHTNLTLSLIHI